ncbi:FAD-binding and (Fe-S)-binding domain-containing protein [Pedobacter arcticus]|uniref:FAD-binding and (Fe-S)-binding domain-containing protein n=1 Tax=Pedobacter arcticus TaxID=752140 RepID=UPI0002DC9909|nr:FAD-binding and (Fe-S)-binding domain-containing protein [Pedobacter arcticus]
MKRKLKVLAKSLEGDLFWDQKTLILYATDASAYREMPLAVAIPLNIADLKKLITFVNQEKISLIPRTAGTSLAGQVVGNGIVVDVSKYFNQIIEVNPQEKWVRVQPGVVRDELNLFLKPYGLFFGPETSTSNRAMIGGMVGNNSCGSNSIVYGSTRDHLLTVDALLSDGSEVVFKELCFEDFVCKCLGDSLESKIYNHIRKTLSDYNNQEEIRAKFPKHNIPRRNTGYAIDALLDSSPFTPVEQGFNFCKLIAGSEGTLAFITEVKLNLVDIPTGESGLLCIHFNSIEEALRANLIALKYKPRVSELIDHYILECTKGHREHMKNRFFVKGDPAAILIVEYLAEDRIGVEQTAALVQEEMQSAGLGYHFPLLLGTDMKKVWELRKAGLGLLSNLPGDEKAVAVIEDTAVDVADLPEYIKEFNELLKKHQLSSVHYAHAGSGELHLRPIINLKTEEGNRMFRVIAEEVATLVKKYRGSLSGEHGDGRLRGEFLEKMVGTHNYQLLKEIKQTWDPLHIFNPGKIIDTPPMNTMLRYNPGQVSGTFNTLFRYNGQNILQHAEQCNGSGDCRKSHLSGGMMCPSYMVTRDEKDTTRARANILREMLTRQSFKINPFEHKEIKDVMDLCISCKGCKSECPSNVDVAKLKAEFLQHYYDANGVKLRVWLISKFNILNKLGTISPVVYNWSIQNKLTAGLIKLVFGFATERSLPSLPKNTLTNWFNKRSKADISIEQQMHKKGTVYFYCDEFINYHDSDIGIKAITLLEKLGYHVILTEPLESGRVLFSKGLLRQAKKIAQKNIQLLSPLINDTTPLIGLEPSAILSFRDEYLDLVDEDILATAKKLSTNTLLIDEFILREVEKGKINSSQFNKLPKSIKLHGHCHQKVLSDLTATQKILSLPENYHTEIIPSGCCGMAGSFGYEKEHYEISMKIGELVLLPAVRQQPTEVIIAATGTSCRHQIKDGTNRTALHPVEILLDALL